MGRSPGDPREMVVRLEYRQDGVPRAAHERVELPGDADNSRQQAEEAALEVVIALTEALRLHVQPAA